MRRVVSSVAGALVAVLALSGCIGIPTSGGVEAGPLIGDQGTPEIVVLPDGPRAGAEPEEILRDFMLALRGPQSDYAIARLFLTPELNETWNPDLTTTIRQEATATTPGPVENSLRYTFTSNAYVDAEGRYYETAPGSQTLDFGFTQQAGEWRISSALDGIVLSQSSFSTVAFTERALYFFDPTFTYLVPDVRWFPSRPTTALRVGRALTAGPLSWLAPGVLSAFPEATKVESVTTRDGVATVALSAEALAATPENRNRMRQQLLASLDVSSVVMTVNDLELVTPDSGVGAVRNPGVDPALLLGTPTQFGFETDNGVADIPELSPKLVEAGATAVTLSADHTSAAFLSAGGVSVARAGDAPPQLVDPRPGLVAPALDPLRFVWSAQASSAATLRAFDYSGNEFELQSGLPADASVVSIDVSRDGTRLLVSLLTSSGPHLYVASVIRDQSTAPTGLGEPLLLSSPTGTLLDATWVDDRRVASISQGGEGSFVTLIEIGGKTSELGEVASGVSIVGGNRREGLRVLDADGAVWRLQGGNWVETDIVASFLGTKQ